MKKEEVLSWWLDLSINGVPRNFNIGKITGQNNHLSRYTIKKLGCFNVLNYTVV